MRMDREKLKQEIRRSVRFSFSRSGGPGGQNVNKRDTKVTAKLDVELLSVDMESMARLKRCLMNRMNGEGMVVIQVDGARTQGLNRRIALERLEIMVTAALRSRPRVRYVSKPSRAAKERRLAAKKRRAAVKSRRLRAVPNEE